MSLNRVIKAFVISIILVTTSIAIAPSVIAQPTFHKIKGTLYIDDAVADPGVDIKFEVSAQGFSVTFPTIAQDEHGYNFYTELFPHDTYGNAKVEFKVKYEGSFVKPIDNESIILDGDIEPVAEYILDLHVDETSEGDGDGDGDGDGGGTNGGDGGYVPSGPSNEDPTADANGPYIEFENVEITFDGSGSTDDGTIVNYTWNFGDGSKGYSVSPTHAYDTPGEYTVILTVEDDEGATDIDATTATISPQPNIPPIAPVISGPENGTNNTEYTFTISSTDADGDDIKYIIDWGDGETDTTDFATNGTVVTQTHTYAEPGTYTISVKANDNQTDSSTTTHTIVIEAEEIEEEAAPDYLGLIALIIIILILLIVFTAYILGKKKKGQKKSKTTKPKNKTKK